jgi:hypothetical protein
MHAARIFVNQLKYLLVVDYIFKIVTPNFICFYSLHMSFGCIKLKLVIEFYLQRYFIDNVIFNLKTYFLIFWNPSWFGVWIGYVLVKECLYEEEVSQMTFEKVYISWLTLSTNLLCKGIYTNFLFWFLMCHKIRRDLDGSVFCFVSQISASNICGCQTANVYATCWSNLFDITTKIT